MNNRTSLSVVDSPWLIVGVGITFLVIAVVLIFNPYASSMTSATSTVIAALLAAAATFVGYLFQRVAQKRAQNAAEEENRRLKLEAAMKAASLVAPVNGTAPDQASVGAALLALCDLGQVELAVTVLGDTWHPLGQEAEEDAAQFACPPPLGSNGQRHSSTPSASKVSNATAILVIDKALSSESAGGAQIMAAEILCRRSRALCSTLAVNWPRSIDGIWRPDLPYLAKLYTIDGLIRMAVSDRPEGLALSALAVRLFGIYESERQASTRPGEHDRVRRCASRMLQAIMPALCAFGWESVMGRQGGAVLMEALDSAAKYATGHQPAADLLGELETERSKCLQTWSDRCTGQIASQLPLSAAG